MSAAFDHWLKGIPKCELHLHIDGSLQAGRMLSLAEKNGVKLPYSRIADVEAAYDFTDLQSFLDLYYLGASVLRDEGDFYWLMRDYLLRCHEENIRHAEIMVEPQTYLPNGVSLAAMMQGFRRAIHEARQDWGISVGLILSFLRHLPEEDALNVLNLAEPWYDDFVAIGLASSEVGNPPQKFARLYERARDIGLALTAHAGEEGPPSYIWEALDRLQVSRIDHGVRCIEDRELLRRLVVMGVPLTVCPLSNVRLRVFDTMAEHNLLQLLTLGVKVTVNSDDPTYFGGFLSENFSALARAFPLSGAQVKQLLANAFEASYLADNRKQRLLAELQAYPDFLQ